MTGLVSDETLRIHARTVVEGEGAEEHDPALVEAVARALAEAEACHANDWRWFVEGARAALSTIRKHQAGEDA